MSATARPSDAPSALDPAPAGSEPPLTDAYRPIRRIALPHAPVAGMLAAAGERRVLLADAEACTGRVFLGRSDLPHHLLVPLDLVRRAGGHDLELPWCREPLARLLDRRAAENRPLAGGELVTVAVSLARGACEAWEDVPPEAEPPPGRWWIDDEGRPLFAPADDGAPVAEEASALLERAAAHTKDRVLRRVIEEARDALERPRRLHRALGALEDALFECYAPRAIERGEGRAADAGAVVRLDDAPELPAGPSPGASLAGILGHFTDPGLADAVGDALDRTRTAARRALGTGRRLPVLVGAAAAVLVVVGGLMWPTDPEPADAHAAKGATPTPSATTPGTAAPAPEPSGTADAAVEDAQAAAEDAQTAAERLRADLADCAAHGDPLCAGIRDDPAEPFPDEVLAAVAASTEAVLLDDYGDVAVFRVQDADGAVPAVLMQLVRLDGRWLIRSAQALSGAG
ncbi:hypothetical protein [Microbacterium paludicola]|uniref:hypothetical protein n=1 Tax=Microbacterium paludicola TaxID=300019 RepID=UPI0031D2766C